MPQSNDFTTLNGVPVADMSDEQIAAASRALEEAKAARIIASFEDARKNYIRAVAVIEEKVKPYGLDAERFITMTPTALRAHILNRIDAARGAGTPRSARVAPKYRNPHNPEQTWTGRGNRPHWVRDFENGGGRLEDARIPAGEAGV